MKKIFAAFLSILALVMLSSTTLATNYDEVSAQSGGTSKYTDINYIAPALSVSGTTASYSLVISGKANVKSLSATLQLQVKNTNGSYTDYGSSWPASSTTSYLSTSGTKTVASGSTYRLKVTVTAYTSTGSSTETAYSPY